MKNIFYLLAVVGTAIALPLLNACCIWAGWNVFVGAFQIITLPHIKFLDVLLLMVLISLIKGPKLETQKEKLTYAINDPKGWGKILGVVTSRAVDLAVIYIISLFV